MYWKLRKKRPKYNKLIDNELEMKFAYYISFESVSFHKVQMHSQSYWAFMLSQSVDSWTHTQRYESNALSAKEKESKERT